MNTAIEFKNIKKVYENKVVLERFNFLLQRVNLLRSSVLPDVEKQRF